MILFSIAVFAQDDKGIPPWVKAPKPTPTPTPTSIATIAPLTLQEKLRQHTNPDEIKKLDKKKFKKKKQELESKLKILTEKMTIRSEECSKKGKLKVYLDKSDYMNSHHRLNMLFGNIDPDLPPPSASCQVCIDANQAIKDYYSCLLKDDEKNQIMIGTDFKQLSNDPYFYDFMKVRYELTDTLLKNMEHFYQYLNEQIK